MRAICMLHPHNLLQAFVRVMRICGVLHGVSLQSHSPPVRRAGHRSVWLSAVL